MYELTGPCLPTFADAAQEIAQASGRSVSLETVPLEAFLAAVSAYGLSDEEVSLMRYLFTEVLDGRNASVAYGVDDALHRPARDFKDFARGAARAGAWKS